MQLEQLQNEAQRKRWQEILNHDIVVLDVQEDEVDEGFLVMTLDPDSADLWGIHPVLTISDSGTVGEYDVNQPFHYQSMQELLTAAAVRTSIT